MSDVTDKSKTPVSTSPAQDEYFLDSPALRTFIGDVRRIVASQSTLDAQGETQIDPVATLDALQPRFAELLADQSWLTDEFAAPYV